MTSSKLVFGFVGVASVIGGAFLFNNTSETELSSDISQEKMTYLLGSINNVASNNIPTTELILVNKKNFICKIDNKEIKDCNLYQLNSRTRIDQPLTLTNIQNNNRVVFAYPESKKNEIINGKNIEIWTKDKQKLIFKIFFENLDKQKAKGFFSKTIIAQVEEVNDSVKDNGKSTYKCKIKSKEVNCEIFKLSDSFNLTKKINSSFGSDLLIEKQIEVKEDLPNKSFVIIKTIETDLYASDWINEKISIYVDNGSAVEADKKFIDIKYVASVSNDLTEIPQADYSYLIVSSETIAGSPAVGDTAMNGNNYQCVVPVSSTSSIADNTCEIYKSSESNADNKLDLHKITNTPETQKIASPLTANHKYILKIKTNRLNKMSSQENLKITVVNKSDSTKKYIYLNKKHLISNQNNEFKTNLLVVKVNSKTGSINATSENIYKCKFTSTQKEKQNCKVYGFSATQTINDSSDIQTGQLQALTTSVNANNHLLIEIIGENNKFTEKELRSFTPEIYASSTENESVVLKAEYVYSYVGKASLNPANSSEILRINPSEEDYLVVVFKSKPATVASDEIVQNSAKNYTCKTENNLVDDTCVLTFISDPTANQAIQYSAVTPGSSTQAQKSHFETNKFFKIKINNPKILSQVNTGSIITIGSTKSSETNNYGDLTVISKTFHDKRIVKTPLYLVKAKGTITTNQNITDLKCKLLNEIESSSCLIYKFSSNANQVNTLNFSQSSGSIAGLTDIAQDKYYVVKFSDENHQLPNAKLENQTLNLKSTSNTEITNFDIVAPIYSTNVVHSSGTVILLK